ncbi:DUF4167 domain-containing protein [Roseinatronobacter alkalisoli]|uniref:DUF4167 domain-containing protein n=1 Tax=Roseinatronobacter alkalisoli TaxID=3028235 RepID=A0ABT5T8M5_9RHOB|nr:DUF4167 domain-containing protein [Roseinatronobacter sp. HJB301]MDD7971474.1 DUF4167 domain-containing protein [Roseinatronobacter sp. HJB301]
MRSTKQRSRSKSNRPKSLGNIVNRVFDSSGPEGKVRGTPQQIIEKYQVLARDAQLSNDRVAAENFQQHAEHYTRMLAQAQREMQAEADARRQQQDDRSRQQNDDRGRQQDDRNRQQNDDRNRHQRRSPDDRFEQGDAQQPQQGNATYASNGDSAPQSVSDTRSDAFSVQDQEDAFDSTLVETPEAKHTTVIADRPETPAQPSQKADTDAEGEGTRKPVRRKRTTRPAAPKADAPVSDAAASDEKPKPRRNTRKPRKSSADAQPELPEIKPSAAE